MKPSRPQPGRSAGERHGAGMRPRRDPEDQRTWT